MKYEVQLDEFEGPFDLLLHLITKNEIDIYDIPIVDVTTQYLNYINNMDSIDLDTTSEFLVMAATLLEIKSKMLLPEHDFSGEEYYFDGEDPRETLVKRLLEYKKYKDASHFLQEREKEYEGVLFKEQDDLMPYSRTMTIEEMNHGLEEDLLVNAIKKLLAKMDRFDDDRQAFFKEVKRDNFSVDIQIDVIRGKIKIGEKISFQSLFSDVRTKEEVIVTFLSMLELLKLKEISINQPEMFGEIIIERISEQDGESL